MNTAYIFFDIDGVLNTEDDWRKSKFSINRMCLNNFIDFINYLTDAYGQRPRLIICSTWRRNMNHTGEKNSSAKSLVEEIFSQHGLTIDGSTPVSSKTRQAEIEYFIRRNDVKSYIVIGDDPSLFPNPKDINLYIPDYHTGLTKKDIKKIKKLFKKQNNPFSI